jgi:eukaryotic-like serine/threonine-protein kinase
MRSGISAQSRMEKAMADRDDVKTIDQLWQELLAGDVAGAELSVTEALRYASTLYAASTPGSARERARQRVFESSPASSQEDTMTAITAPIPFPSPDGPIPAAPASWWPEIGLRRKHARWALASLAVALIIVLAGIGGYLLYENRTDQPAVVPAVVPEETEETGWSTWKGNVARTGVADSGPTGQPIELWRFQAQGACSEAPISVGETVYAGCGDGGLYALNAIDGQERWRFFAEDSISGGVVYANGVLYVTDTIGVLYAIDASSGDEFWRTEPMQLDQIAVDSGIVVVSSDETGVLHAFDAATGDRLWEYEIASQEQMTYPAIADGIVYSGGGGITAVDLQTGELLWRKEYPASAMDSPAVVNGIAIIGSSAETDAASLAAFDAETGEELWRRDEAIITPSVIGDVAYSGSASGTVYAFDVGDGSPLWEAQIGGRAWGVAVTDEVVYVSSDADETVYALDAATGEQLWRFDVDDGIENTLAVDRGRVYVNTLAGSVYAIGGSDGPLIPALSEARGANATPPTGDIPVEFDIDAVALHPVEASDLPFMMPQGITTDSDGNFYIADGIRNEVIVLNADGTLVSTIGDDSGPGALDVPTTAVVDATGNVYVASESADRIQKFGPDGTFLDAWPVVGNDPERVFGGAAVSAVDNQDRLWVTDWENHRVRVFDLNGEGLFEFGGFGAGPGQLRFPLTVSFDGHGSVYVPEYLGARVSVFSEEGEFQFSFGEDRLLGPTQTAIDENGYVFVADQEANHVFVFGHDGTYLAEFGPDGTEATTFVRSTGIAINGDGVMLLSDGDEPAVYAVEIDWAND